MKKQRGAALMAMLAVIVLGGSWWLVSALSTPTNRTALDAEHNARVLSQAKSALLGYVAHRALMASENHPGRLPCPEAPGFQNNHDGTKYTDDDDGVAAGSCSLPAVGRLPWRTLGLDKLTDTAGEPLWYVVSPGWAFPSPGADPVINSNSAGQLTLDAQAAVALIIAPGRAFNVAAAGGCTARAQQRARQPNVAWDLRDFLECDNATSPADAAFVSSGPRDSFNDQAIGVTAKEIWMHAEGPVAARIQRDVVPQLQTVYDSPEWGVADPTDPIFPFAAPFADPSASPFKGTAATMQGLLPFTAHNCNALTAGRCDPNFVQWNTGAGAITVTRLAGAAGGNATSWGPADCTASTGSSVSCTITYSRLCVLPLFSVCTVTLGVNIRATAGNVGMALRTQSTAGIVNLTAPTITAQIQNTGAAQTDVQGSMPTASCNPILILGMFVCNVTTTNTVTVPVTVYADHPLVNPATSDAWYWFAANNWHHVSYYALAASHAPSGATHDCTAAGPCLSVTNGTPPANVKALLVLAGRSLTGSARPNANLNDFLDTAQNQDLDALFEQKRVDATFNDRVVTVSNY